MTFEEALRVLARRANYTSEAEAAAVIAAIDDFTEGASNGRHAAGESGPEGEN